MFKNLKIGAKLIWSFLFIITLSILLTSYVEYRIASKAIENQILEDLILVADSMEGYVLEFLEGAKKRVVDFASDGFIRDSAKNIIAGEEDISNDLNKHLVLNKKSLDPSIFGINIIDLNGTVIGSTDEKELGLDYYAKDYFLKTIELEYGNTYSKDVSSNYENFGVQEPYLLVTAPLTDKETHELLGIIVNYVNLDLLDKILLGERQLQLGAVSGTRGRRETLEIYLVNKDKIMITQSRFIKDASLRQRVDTLPVRKCEMLEEISGMYLDYRDIPIVGASMCLRNGWTLLAEIDEAEAFQVLVDLRNNVIYMTMIFLLLSVIYAIFIARKIVSPIELLSEGARIISKGDLSYKVKITSKDEIGQLAKAFNDMVGKLKSSHENISREKEKFETLLKSIGDGVITIDRNWNITLINKATSDISGWTEKEVIGRPFRGIFEFIREQDRKENITFIEDAMVRKKVGFMKDKTILVRKDGEEIPVGDSAAPIFDNKGNVTGAIIVFRDTSKERDAQMLRSDFAYASHQLKTPITRALFSIEHVLREQLRPEIKESINTAFLNTKNVLNLVERLAEVSEIDQGKIILSYSEIKLADIFEDIKKSVEKEAREYGVKLTIEPISPLISIETDSEKLKKALLLIVDNAIKYNSKDGTVKIQTKIQDDKLLITVADTGVGIPEKERAIIFTKFFRGSNIDTTKITGAGLGLFIAREYVKLLKGKVWFESKENKGTTFFVLLPINTK